VMTHPLPCPGRCNLCPEARGAPKSYLPDSPVVLRAGRSGFDPYMQVAGRIKVYLENGHVPSKVEVVVMGGRLLCRVGTGSGLWPTSSRR
jgi:elongator complex protein 3